MDLEVAQFLLLIEHLLLPFLQLTLLSTQIIHLLLKILF
jgi:hypothetical protein